MSELSSQIESAIINDQPDVLEEILPFVSIGHVIIERNPICVMYFQLKLCEFMRNLCIF